METQRAYTPTNSSLARIVDLIARNNIPSLGGWGIVCDWHGNHSGHAWHTPGVYISLERTEHERRGVSHRLHIKRTR
jgi:hypothetical protein